MGVHVFWVQVLVWVRSRIKVSVSIGGRGSFLGSFRVRVRIRCWFWLGPGTQLNPKNLLSSNFSHTNPLTISDILTAAKFYL